MTTPEPVLALRAVTAGFGANTVLRGVDLEVQKGSAVGLFGLNGAGKSVTMKVVAGLVPMRSGQLLLRGEDISGEPPERRVPRGLAYLPQSRQLFPRLTVEQNLRLGGYVLRRGDKQGFSDALDDVYVRFPRLAQRRRQLAGSMSGGEQAMLAIARALVSRPEILLIDEPSAGLAPAVIANVLEMLLQLRGEGLTILLVEQNVSFGFRLVDRAAIMQRGQVVYAGEIAHLDVPRVAELLGVGRLLSKGLGSAVEGKRAPAGATRKRRAPAVRRTTQEKP